MCVLEGEKGVDVEKEESKEGLTLAGAARGRGRV